MKVWVVAITKMEELYVREWIEWYKSIGVDHIVIGDNNDSDYEHQLKPIIQDYIDEGYVEYVDLLDRNVKIMSFFNDIYKKNIGKFDWISLLDLDEFVELPAYDNDIKKFLSSEKVKDYDAVTLPWLTMTDNGHVYYENKPVKERFTEHIIFNKVSLKYFVKSLDFISKFRSRYCPFNVEYKEDNPNCSIRFTDGVGYMGNYIWNDIDDFRQFYPNYEHYKNAYIKHYVTKSAEEFMNYKKKRGRLEDSESKKYTRDFYMQKQVNNDIELYHKRIDTLIELENQTN